MKSAPYHRFPGLRATAIAALSVLCLFGCRSDRSRGASDGGVLDGLALPHHGC